MKNNEKLHLVVLVTAVVISLLVLVPSETIGKPLTITETQITKSGSASSPDIYGDKIVWTDGNIYMYDLSSKEEIKITNDEYSNYNPAIFDSKIVYESVSNTEPESFIYMYDLSTKTTIFIDYSYYIYNTNPAIYRSRIVWSGSSILMHDLSTNIKTQISSGDSASNPDIYEDKIVWTDGNIYMYDLFTEKETKITNSGSAFYPRIYGDKIVWEDHRRGDYSDVYMYDLSTQKETLIANNGSAPAIYKSKIVWTDGNIYMYDLSTNTKTQITKSGSASYPSICEDRIVWEDGSNIYMATLCNSTQPEVLKINDFTAKIRCGTAPLKTEFFSDVTGKNIVKWRWDFESSGKDCYSKHAVTAKHTFTKPGVYDITLTVWNDAGQNATLTKKDYIVVKPRSKK